MDDVSEAADKLRRCQDEARGMVDSARVEFVQKIRLAHDEGVPLATIARAAGYSREYIRQLDRNHH